MKQNINFSLGNKNLLAGSIFNNPIAFIEYSNNMDDIYKYFEE